MSKSRFDKGSTIGNGRWDEEEHPRGKDGRFATSGGGASSESLVFNGEGNERHFNSSKLVKDTGKEEAVKIGGVQKFSKDKEFMSGFESGLKLESSPNHAYSRGELKSIFKESQKEFNYASSDGDRYEMGVQKGRMTFCKIIAKNWNKGKKSEYDV